MRIFDRDKKKEQQPAKKQYVYVKVAYSEKLRFEAACKEAGYEYRMEQGDDGLLWYHFEESLGDAVVDILDEIRKPEPRKVSLNNQVGSAASRAPGNRPQIPDNPLTRATAEAEKRFDAEKRVAAAQRGELQRPSVRAQLQKKPEDLAPPTGLESRRAIDKAIEELTEQIADAEAEIQEADALVASSKELAPAEPSKERKKRKSLGRTNQIKTRLTDAELAQFQRRVKKSGLSQGDYLRSAALTGEIRIEERSMADLALLDELALIRRDLGKQGGLLKMVIKPNEGQRELAPEEWKELIQTLRDMEDLKKRLADLEVRVQHGNTETQGKQESSVR